MGLLDRAAIKRNQPTRPTNRAAEFMREGNQMLSKGLASRADTIGEFAGERAEQQEGALEMLLRAAPDEATRLAIEKEARSAGDLGFARSGEVADTMTKFKTDEATEIRAVADQLMDQEKHDTAKEEAKYNITQRLLERQTEEQALKTATDQEKRAAETYAETQKGYPYAADKRARTAKTEEIAHQKALRTEADRTAVNDIVSTSQNPAEYNRRAEEFLKKGGKDKDGQIKKYANQALLKSTSKINEESVYAKDITDEDGELIKGTGIIKGNLKSHSRANYNKLIEKEYRRLQQLNPHADDALLRTKATNAVKRTSAQTMFERQGWYEKLTDPAAALVRETQRKEEVHTESRKLLLDTSKAYSASIADPDKRGDFQETLRKLNIFANNNPNIVKQGTLNQIDKFTEKGIRDVIAIDFDPTGDYNEFIQELDPSRNLVDPGVEGDTATYNPLTIDDFSPTHRQTFLDEQTALIQADFPDASELVIRQKLSDKIQKSPLGVLYITGSHKAALKATHERFTVKNRNAEIEYRLGLAEKFIKGGGKGQNISAGAAKLTYNEVFARINPNLKLTAEETGKLRNEIEKVYTKWNSYFINDNLKPEQRLSVNIAIHEILSGIELDRDDKSNFLTFFLDETDITVAGIDMFDDASNIKKNQALTAILGHIDTGRRPAVTKYLQRMILAEIPRNNKAAKAKVQKQINDSASLGGGVGLKNDKSFAQALGAILSGK